MYAEVANQSEIYLDAGFSVVLNYVWDIDYFKIFLGKFANQKTDTGRLFLLTCTWRAHF